MDSPYEMTMMPAEKSPVMVTSMRVANAIHGLLTDPSVHMTTLSTAIHAEPCISAAVLRVANSAAFARESQVTDLKHAIALIGTAKVRVLALQIVLRQLVEGIRHARARKVAEAVWAHSIELGCLAEQIAKVRGVDGDYCHVLALFHDLPAFQFLNSAKECPEQFASDATMAEAAARWPGPRAALIGRQLGLPETMLGDLALLDESGASSPVVDVMRAAHGCVECRYPFDRFSGPRGWDAPDEVLTEAQARMDAYMDMVRLH
jgi:hypothetical protein